VGIFAAIKYIVILLIIIAIGAGGWYIMNLKADLAVSEMNNKKLEEGIASQQALISQMIADIEQIKDINTNLQEQNQKQQQDVAVLTSKFSKRDFGALASERPKAIERLINRAVENVARCFELATGAPLNEKELNATTATEANRECPALVNPAFSSPN